MNGILELDNGWRVIDHTKYNSRGTSRGEPILTSIDTLKDRYFVSDTEVIIIQLDDKQWWITCSRFDDEDTFTDIGPFETFDDVVVHFRLVSTVEQR